MKTSSILALCVALGAWSGPTPAEVPGPKKPVAGPEMLAGDGYGACDGLSIYMGCPVELATADHGALGNALLVEQRARLMPAVYLVSDTPGRRVWSIVGMGMAGAAVIEGDGGLVVVDAGEDLHNAREHIAQIRVLSDKPVVAVIFSHWHYTDGAGAYEEAWPGQPIQFWGHESLHELKTGSIGALGPAIARRAWRHFGVDLPHEGADAVISVGIGNEFIDLRKGIPEQAYRKPTRTVRGDGDEHEIAGLRFQFFNYESDTSDSLVIWMPETRVVVNNHIWNVLANLYTLRGTTFRRPDQWIGSVDRILALQPEALVNVHGLPIIGAERIQRAAIQYRDAMQFIYDQTVRGINRGMHVEDIVESLRLPDELRLASVNRPNYGELAHHVRGVYYGLMGWFAEDAVEINPLPRRERAARIVAGFGGADATRSMAAAALEDRQYQWAAELTGWLLLVDPEDVTARQLQADALRALGQVTPAGSSRNFYLTQALDREGKLNMRRPSIRLVNSGRLLAAPPGTYVDALRYAYDPAVSRDPLVFGIRFTDLDLSYGLTLRNGVVLFSEGMPERPDLAIELPRPLWAQLLTGEVSPPAALAGDLAITTGSPADLNAFFARFDAAGHD